MTKRWIRSLILATATLLLTVFSTACKRAPDFPAPENVVVALEDGVLHAAWDSVAGANCYYIYRARQGDESFGYWGITTKTAFYDQTITAPAAYAYKIFAATTDGNAYARSDAAAVTEYVCVLTQPVIESVAVSTNGCTVTWEPQALAEEYEVLRSDTETGAYEVLARTGDTSYTDAGASAQKSYDYRIRARSFAYGRQSESPASAPVRSLTPPASPHALRQNKLTALIYWDPVPEAEHYVVYRATTADGPYAVIGQTEARMLWDTTLTADMRRAYYAVQSCADTESVTSRSLLTAACAVKNPAVTVAVPVIMYHDFITPAEVAGGLAVDEYAIYESEFEADLQYLADNGYHTIQVADLIDWLDGKAKLPDNPILLSIDDGTRGVYEYAYPLLQRYGMKATLNVIGACIDEAGTRPDRLSGGKAYCSWEEIGEMGRTGAVEVLPHGYRLHTYSDESAAGFSRLHGESMTAYCERLSDDLLPLNAKITQYTGNDPRGVAYPYSVWSEESNLALASLGYRFLLSGDRARAAKMNYFIAGLDPSLQDPLLARIVRLSGTSLGAYLKRAAESDKW